MRLFLAVLLFILAQAHAQAEESTFYAKSGIMTEVYYKVSWYEEKCKRIRMTHSIIKQPRNGTVKQMTGLVVIDDTIELTRGGSIGRCREERITASKFWYQSEPGFTGTDQFSFRSVHEDGYRDSDIVTIIVE